MSVKNIVLTGATGNLGKRLLKNLGQRNIFAPSRKEMDITNKNDVEAYFKDKKIDAIIHCAAMTKMADCENTPIAAFEVNVVGTANIAHEAIKKNARIIYISTDYVYPCKSGPYSEKDATIPFTAYGWSKLGGECAAKMVKNHCVIRTSFFDPEKINFDDAPTDAYFSKIPIDEIAHAVMFLLDSDFIGTINVGHEKASIFDILKKHRPSLKPVSIKEIEFNRAVDSSLDIGLWNKIRETKND